MNLPRPHRILAVAAMVLGVAWVFGVIILPWLSGGATKTDWLFALVITPVMVLPGGLLAYFGYDLTRSNEPKRIKRVVGCFAFFAVLFVASEIDAHVKWPGADDFKSACVTLVCTLMVIPIYLHSVAWVLRREGTPVEKSSSLLGKVIVVILAFELHNVISAAVRAFAPLKPGFQYVHQAPWEMIGALGSIVIAWLFYVIVVWQLKLPPAPRPVHRSFRLTS